QKLKPSDMSLEDIRAVRRLMQSMTLYGNKKFQELLQRARSLESPDALVECQSFLELGMAREAEAAFEAHDSFPANIPLCLSLLHAHAGDQDAAERWLSRALAMFAEGEFPQKQFLAAWNDETPAAPLDYLR